MVGEEVWTVPGRSGRPITNRHDWQAKTLAWGQRDEAACNFCPENLVHTPAEKSRLVEEAGRVVRLDQLLPAQASATRALFRRVPNLYEIVTWEYWKANYGLQLNEKQQAHKLAYLADDKGRAHLRQVLGEKLARLGRLEEEIEAMGELLFKHADAFFGGSHDLVVAGHHYAPEASTEADLLHAGALTPQQHFHYLDFAFDSAAAIRRENPHVKWVSLYQNWRSAAGASFDHLHKQVLGIDSLPPTLQRCSQVLEKEPDFYNRVLLPLAKKENMALAENTHALALAEPGQPFPTVTVYSKSAARSWKRMEEDEKRDFSDLLWACHRMAGPDLATNEEWMGPAQEGPAMPVHAQVKWRINTPAGFEGGSRLYLNPLLPSQVCERLLDAGHPDLPTVRWGRDCACEKGSLAYRD